ncbi:MAG TPA: gluconate 2-dehydrogenase subunit 3 family protein [Vicinamibacteria bacterium]|nr:gluconate 2-dehydrogenase subunit 3 family protein [Vicinamibacteria bacterium]
MDEDTPTGSTDRRAFLERLASGALGFASLGCLSAAGLGAAQGRAPDRLRVFEELEAELFGAWCDELAPGAADARVASFVDKYLAEPFEESLLLLRVLQNPPFVDFYRNGLAGIDLESHSRYGRSFLRISSKERSAIVEAAATSSTEAWTDPNPFFFYLVSRSDAVDVVYGTAEGFRRLGVPYLPHIRPRPPW